MLPRHAPNTVYIKCTTNFYAQLILVNIEFYWLRCCNVQYNMSFNKLINKIIGVLFRYSFFIRPSTVDPKLQCSKGKIIVHYNKSNFSLFPDFTYLRHCPYMIL